MLAIIGLTIIRLGGFCGDPLFTLANFATSPIN